MAKLKEVRKEGREILCKRNSPYWLYICFRKGFEFYLSEYLDGYEVFRLSKSGSLEKMLNTDHSMMFHKELKRRKKERRR